MLTCFEANTAAKALYDKLGYVVDASSPDPEVDGPEFAGYVTVYALQTNIMCTGTACSLFSPAALFILPLCPSEDS
jgi:hypothetical protein